MHYFFVCYSVIFWNERQFCIFWTVLLQVCFTTFGRQTNRPWIAEGVLVIASILSSEVCFSLYRLLILTSSFAARHPSLYLAQAIAWPCGPGRAAAMPRLICRCVKSRSLYVRIILSNYYTYRICVFILSVEF